jgi:homoprotocatechuate degradation regulator HpaR
MPLRPLSKPARSRPPPVALRSFSRSLPMALLRAREAVMARFRPMLRAHDLSEQQWRVLRALVSDGPQRVSELALHTCISMPSLSRLLGTLEARGVVKRSDDRRDLRAWQVAVTRKGTKLVESLGTESEALYAEIASQLGAARLEQVYELLEDLTRRLDGAAR